MVLLGLAGLIHLSVSQLAVHLCGTDLSRMTGTNGASALLPLTCQQAGLGVSSHGSGGGAREENPNLTSAILSSACETVASIPLTETSHRTTPSHPTTECLLDIHSKLLQFSIVAQQNIPKLSRLNTIS